MTWAKRSAAGWSCQRISATPNATGFFPPGAVFWLFLSQVLSADGSCREALMKFLVGLFLDTGQTASANTSGYCQARAKLSTRELFQTSGRVADKIEATAAAWLWKGRRVKVADGSGLSMPDTRANQKRWPQSSKAKPGCSFPVMRIVALFSLATGAMIGLAHDALAVHERTLMRSLWHLLQWGDVLLADRGFGGFAEFFLLARRGVDCVMRKNGRRKNAGVIKRIAPNDHIVRWLKSGACPKWLDPQTWNDMPQSMAVREVKVRVENPGFRTDVIWVVTTLLDNRAFTAGDIAQLYLRRWKVELFLRDIKITMKMDVLRCKTPAMVEKETWMRVIAYNLVRALMMEAAGAYNANVERISFKGTVSTIRQWAPALSLPKLSEEERLALSSLMLSYLAQNQLPDRPGRVEPRARKRRPKNFQLLNKPRGEFKEIMHRNRYKKA